MVNAERRPWFSSALSALFLLGSGFVLYQSALGRFRSMYNFPLVFAIVVTVVLVASTVYDRRRGFKVRAAVALVTIVAALLAPVAQFRFLAAERRANEARGMEVLAHRTAPEIPYVAAINSDETGQGSFVPGDRVTLVNFWATWCDPCLEEIPLLDTYWREHRAAGFELVGVTRLYGERDEELSAIRKFLVDLDAGYPVFVEDADSRAHAAYRAETLPTSVLVDRGGQVMAYGVGIAGTRRLLARASELLHDPRGSERPESGRSK